MTEQQQTSKLHANPPQNGTSLAQTSDIRLTNKVASQVSDGNRKPSQKVDPSGVDPAYSAQQIPLFDKGEHQTQETEAIQLQSVRRVKEENNSKSFENDLNDHDLAELISDCGSATVDVIGLQNEDGQNANSSRSRSRSQRSSASNPSPELSIDDVSLSDEEQDKVSINSHQELEQPGLDLKAKRSLTNYQNNSKEQEQHNKQEKAKKDTKFQNYSESQQNHKKLQKSANDTTTCSSKTTKGSKNVTSSIIPMANVSGNNQVTRRQDKAQSKEYQIEPSQIEKPAQKSVTSSIATTNNRMPVDEDNILGHQFKRYQQMVETREVNQHTHEFKGNNEEEEPSDSDKNSTTDPLEKDNEDPTAPRNEKFDPKELKEVCDGWKLYKKRQINFGPVRRYQALVDQDYQRNKVTVCAHLQNIYNSFIVKQGRPAQFADNFFNLEKLLSRFAQENPNTGAVTKDEKLSLGAGAGTINMKRQQTQPNIDSTNEYKQKEKKEPDIPNNILLTKSFSTQHIPDNARAKNSKRVYANFDKELSSKMFGYRINLTKKGLKRNVPIPQANQEHKPLTKFVSDVTQLLTKDYEQIQKYHTKQRILVPANSESDEEEENNQESPLSMKSPRKREHDSDEDERDTKLNDAQNNKGKPKKAKYKGELVTVRLRNGDKQSYRKRVRNLMWKIEPERLQSATSNGRKSIQKGRTSEGIQGSPTRSGSMSPKKIGKDGRENLMQIAMNGQKNLNIVRYQNPKTGHTILGAQQRFNSFKQEVNQNATHYGNGGFKRQNSANRTSVNQSQDRKDSARSRRQLRASGDNRNSQSFFEGVNKNGQDNSQLGTKENPVYMIDSKPKQGQLDGKEKNNLINPGILPKDPSKMKPGESQTLVIELNEEQTKLLEEGKLTANGVPIPKDLNKLTYEQIVALLNSLSLPVEVSKDKSQPSKNPLQTPQTNLANKQAKTQSSQKQSQSLNQAKQNILNPHFNSEKKYQHFPDDNGGILNSASFINIKRTGVYNNPPYKSDGKQRGGKFQRPDSTRRSRQNKNGSLQDEDGKLGRSFNPRSSSNTTQFPKGKQFPTMHGYSGNSMGEHERHMIHNVNYQQQQLLTAAQQFMQASMNYEQARKLNGPPQSSFQQALNNRTTGPFSAVQKAQQSLTGQPNFIQTLQQPAKGTMPMVAHVQKKQEPKSYAEIMQNGTNLDNFKGNPGQGKQTMTRLGSKPGLINSHKNSNSQGQQIPHTSLPENIASSSNTTRFQGQSKSAQIAKSSQQQTAQLNSYKYQDQPSNQKAAVSGRTDDRNWSQPPKNSQTYGDSKSMGHTTSKPFNQASMSSAGQQQAYSTDGSTNQQAISSLNRYYQSLNQGSASSQVNQDQRYHPQLLSKSTKNKSSKKNISLDDSKFENKAGSQAQNYLPEKTLHGQTTQDQFANSKPARQTQGNSQPASNRSVAQGQSKQIAGPCTQYYNNLNEQDAQLTAYRNRISQTHMENQQQKRRVERALAQTTMQQVQASVRNRTNSKIKNAREDQTGNTNPLKPIDQKNQGPQNNNFMNNSNELKKSNGNQQQGLIKGEANSIMNRTTVQQHSFLNSNSSDYPAFKNSASLKMQHGQKLMNMGTTYGNGSMPEIQQNFPKVNAGQVSASNQMIEQANSSSINQQYRQKQANMNSQSQQKTQMQLVSGGRDQKFSTTNGRPAFLNNLGAENLNSNHLQK